MEVRTIDRATARELDRRAVEEFGLPSIVLMENAGRGVADTLGKLGVSGRVVICCGPGNNGGDGFVIARHLDLRGIAIEVLAWGWDPAPLTARGPRPRGDAATNLAILQLAKIPLHLNPSTNLTNERLQNASWTIDALLGTGARGEPRPPLDAVIDTINASGVPILAVDVPSGLDCDTGQPAQHTVRAEHTCTFVATKPGFLVPNAAAYTGQVHVLDIGAPRLLVEEILN